MVGFYPAGEPERTRWTIVDALRRYGTDSARLAHAFATGHGLQALDVQALVAVMSAEGNDDPLTPGRLRTHLGLSSAGTSYVIDRLEKAGHVRRSRDHPSDNRVVHLRYTDRGRATALDFFGPLGELTDQVMDTFDPAELATVSRFLTAAADALHRQVDRPAAADGPSVEAPRSSPTGA